MQETVQDHNGKISSKRVITFISFFLIVMGYVGNMFWGLTVEEFMYDALSYITIGGIFGVAAEKFTKSTTINRRGTK